MEFIRFSVLATTAYVLFYALSIGFEVDASLILLLFSLSPIPLIWMVYRVLKYGVPSKYKFEDRFYDDYNYTRYNPNNQKQ